MFSVVCNCIKAALEPVFLLFESGQRGREEESCLSLGATFVPRDEVLQGWVWRVRERSQARAMLAISAHGLPEQVAGGSGAGLGHGGSAVAGCKGAGSEAPARRRYG